MSSSFLILHTGHFKGYHKKKCIIPKQVLIRHSKQEINWKNEHFIYGLFWTNNYLRRGGEWAKHAEALLYFIIVA